MSVLVRDELIKLLEDFSGLRIGVVGDFALDAYWYADMTRSALSRETPLPTRPVVDESYAPGAGANVARQLACLGATVTTFSIVGDDWRGQILLGQLGEADVETSGVVKTSQFATTMFAKVILSADELLQEDARLDFVAPGEPPDWARTSVIDAVVARIPDLDALIISDYDENGVIGAGMAESLGNLCKKHAGIVFAADSRNRIGSFDGMVRTPNILEAARWLMPGQDGPVGVDQITDAALHHVNDRPTHVTLGVEGCLVFDGEGMEKLPAIPPDGQGDPVGAGDAFLAAVSAGLVVGATPRQAGMLANLAAGVTVAKIRETGTTSPVEILDLYDATTPRG